MRKEPNGRRLGHRAPTSTRARVYDSGGRSTEVQIKDLSPHGARLLVAPGAPVPPCCLIRFGEYEAQAEVVWRKEGEVGIRFIVPGEDEGRVRAPDRVATRKTPLAELRGSVRRRRRLFGFLTG